MIKHRRNINTPGDAHELTFSCYHRFPFLKAERTCAWLAQAIDAAREKYQFAVWAYVFMPDHAHVIVCPQEKVYDIALIRKAIKAPVASAAIEYMGNHAPDWLPKITRQRGRRTERLFWQSGGGYDRNIWSAEVLLDMIAYIHANPVRKGLVLRPADWKWSSAAWYQSLTPGPLRLNKIPMDWLR
jgi:putative transposase